MDCLEYAGSTLDAERVFSAFLHIDEAADVRSLTSLLTAPLS